ncbi:hypothetical protein Aduo_006707 [Ancylostoma duodenale]
MYDRVLEVNALSTRCQELGRQAERLEEHAENEKRRRKDKHEMFVEKLREARSAVSAEQLLTEKYKQKASCWPRIWAA